MPRNMLSASLPQSSFICTVSKCKTNYRGQVVTGIFGVLIFLQSCHSPLFVWKQIKGRYLPSEAGLDFWNWRIHVLCCMFNVVCNCLTGFITVLLKRSMILLHWRWGRCVLITMSVSGNINKTPSVSSNRNRSVTCQAYTAWRYLWHTEWRPLRRSNITDNKQCLVIGLTVKMVSTSF